MTLLWLTALLHNMAPLLLLLTCLVGATITTSFLPLRKYSFHNLILSFISTSYICRSIHFWNYCGIFMIPSIRTPFNMVDAILVILPCESCQTVLLVICETRQKRLLVRHESPPLEILVVSVVVNVSIGLKSTSMTLSRASTVSPVIVIY